MFISHFPSLTFTLISVHSVLVYDFVYRYKLLESNENLPLLVLIVVPLDSIISVNIRDTSVTVYLSEAAKIFTGVDRQNLTDEMKNKFNGAQNTIDITKGQIEMSLEHTVRKNEQKKFFIYLFVSIETFFYLQLLKNAF